MKLVCFIIGISLMATTGFITLIFLVSKAVDILDNMEPEKRWHTIKRAGGILFLIGALLILYANL